MKSIKLYDLKKYKKFYASLIGVVLFILLIEIFGIKFFLFDLVFDRNKYQIRAEHLSNITIKLIITNLKNIIILFLVLRLKHGHLYKYGIISVTTFVCMFVLTNIVIMAQTVGDLLSMCILYLPKYINIYIYIITQEKLSGIVELYNRSKKLTDEIISLIKMLIVVLSVTIIISVLQAVLSLIIL